MMTQSLQAAALTASLVQKRVPGQLRARDSSRSSSDGNKQNKQSPKKDAIEENVVTYSPVFPLRCVAVIPQSHLTPMFDKLLPRCFMYQHERCSEQSSCFLSV